MDWVDSAARDTADTLRRLREVHVAKNQVSIRFNQGFFDTILRSSKVTEMTDAAAERALAAARANAPVDTGAYRAGLHVEHHEAKYRTTSRVVGGDEKTLLVESRTGNLARALKAAKQ